MGRTRVAEVLGIAAVTTTVTLGLLWPVAGGAGGPKKENQPEIAWPALKEKGWNVTLRAKKDTYKAGEIPSLEVVAVRTEENAENCRIEIRLLAENPASRFSRMIMMPEELWKYDCTLTADGDTTQAHSISTGVKIPEGKSVSFTMKSGSRTAMSRSLTGPAVIPLALLERQTESKQVRVAVARK